MKVIIFGGSWQLGKYLLREAPQDWQVISVRKSEVDITDLSAVILFVRQNPSDLIINAAAYTSVDMAERERYLADAVNHLGVRNLALAAKAAKAKLIHISTDYVFDGVTESDYSEFSLPNPANVYGETKLAGEVILRKLLPESLIVRTSWIFSEFPGNFLSTI